MLPSGAVASDQAVVLDLLEAIARWTRSEPVADVKSTEGAGMTSYIVITTGGTLQLLARTRAEAISTALELTGPGAALVAIHRDDEWA